ncbi:MAG TPA: alpha/beta hydrolase [Pyrinomonadaceae bacterium]|jgi:pimeloyl-ACP methyl ester carboxylesterase
MKKRYLEAGAAVGAVGGLVALKMLTRAREVNWDDGSEFVPHAENSHFTDVDGLHMHYQQFGEHAAPVLLLIHGYTSSTAVWRTVAPLFAGRGFQVIAVDLIGFGFSVKPSWFDYSIQSQARVVSRFMNRLGIGKATVVGSSYGGAVASTLALDYPERVEKLVLAGSVCNDDAKKHPVLRLANLPGMGEIISAFLSDSPRFVRRRMRNTLAPANHHLITDERINTVRLPLRAKDAHHSVLMTARNWSACRIEQDAQFISQPTLLVWGENDTVIPIQNGYKLHDAILNSRLVVFKDCGHNPQEEKSEDFVDVVSEFVKDKKGRIAARDDEQMRMESNK